jgi:hypothetical protein
MRYFLILSAWLLIFVGTTFAEPDQNLHNKCLYPTILVTSTGRTHTYGSGVIVKSIKLGSVYHNIFLTCAHVTYDKNPYIIRVYSYKDWSTLEGYRMYSCIFYSTNEQKDLAIGMFISDEKMPTVELDFTTKLYIGTNIFGIGCGIGDEPRLDNGQISAVRIYSGKNPSKFIRSSTYTVPGDSGSGIFHNYKLIGIRQSIRAHDGKPMFSISYATPVEYLQSWDEGAYDFIWRDKEIPKLPYYILDFNRRFMFAQKE